MADLTFWNTQAREPGIKFLTGSFFGNNGLSPTVTSGDFFSSITRTAVGEFTVQVQYKYPAIVWASVSVHTQTPASAVLVHLYKTVTAQSLSTIFSTGGTFQVAVTNFAGAGLDPTPSSQIFMMFAAQNTTV